MATDWLSETEAERELATDWLAEMELASDEAEDIEADTLATTLATD